LVLRGGGGGREYLLECASLRKVGRVVLLSQCLNENMSGRGDNGLVYKVSPSIPRDRVLVCMNSVHVVVCHALRDVVEC
jgi:hypothetical protein